MGGDVRLDFGVRDGVFYIVAMGDELVQRLAEHGGERNKDGDLLINLHEGDEVSVDLKMAFAYCPRCGTVKVQEADDGS